LLGGVFLVDNLIRKTRDVASFSAMRISLVFILLLAGCSNSTQSAEAVLNDYALAAANSADLSSYLTGPALESANQSAELIRELGLTSYGATNFSRTTELAPDLYQSCLDVSATSFRDGYGDLLQLERVERQLVEVRFSDGKVSNLELLGAPC
jgi:hypothetical protein